MDVNEKLTTLRAMTDCDDSDTVLLVFLENAKRIILARKYPYIVDDDEYDALEMPKKYEWRQLQIAQYLLNKRGAEGETQHTENGINRYYGHNDVPPDLLKDILPQIDFPR